MLKHSSHAPGARDSVDMDDSLGRTLVEVDARPVVPGRDGDRVLRDGRGPLGPVLAVRDRGRDDGVAARGGGAGRADKGRQLSSGSAGETDPRRNGAMRWVERSHGKWAAVWVACCLRLTVIMLLAQLLCWGHP